jgi:hypothetical protein
MRMTCLSFFGFCLIELVCFNYALKIQTEGWQQPAIDPSLLPIEFVHVPKTGSSFINTLLHIPGACSNLPDDPQEIERQINAHFILPASWRCNASVVDTARGRLAHTVIARLPEGGFERGQGRFMMMMRQPEQRLLSANAYMPDSEVTLATIGDISGCVTKMLTATVDGNRPCLDSPPPTRADVDLAKRRLQTGFSFIGMTDQWELSICLFNTMFNQECRAFQFHDSRPTNGQQGKTDYDTSVLRGYTDPYDNEVFSVGRKIFEANLAKYNVSESSCQSCWSQAGLK